MVRQCSNVVALAVAVACWSSTLHAEKPRATLFEGRTPPDLVSQPEHWLNGGEGPLLRDLSGKAVWLQFNY